MALWKPMIVKATEVERFAELVKQSPQMMKVKEIWIDMETGRAYFLEDASSLRDECAPAHIEYINLADLCSAQD